MMFTSEDLKVFDMEIGWDRNDALGEVFFPKLGAIQAKINSLIYEIYGIDVNERYMISSTPTSSKKPTGWNNNKVLRRDKKYSLRSNDPYGVRVALRCKVKDASLLLKSGRLTHNHFALLGAELYDFSCISNDHGIVLGVLFNPYVAYSYAQSVRDNFISIPNLSHLFILPNLATEFAGTRDLFLGNDKAYDLFDGGHNAAKAFTEEGSQITFFCIDPLLASDEEVAKLAVVGAAAFPLIEAFTEVSSGRKITQDYVGMFLRWRFRETDEKYNLEESSERYQEYISNFTIEPISEASAWKSEELTRGIFESLLGVEFKKQRPGWLKSTKGANLELDGYNEELSLAFEYQGEYHYMELPIHHQTRSLKEVQRNDARKQKVCSKKNVDLIQVPYWEKGNRDFILQQLHKLNRPDIEQRLLTHCP